MVFDVVGGNLNWPCIWQTGLVVYGDVCQIRLQSPPGHHGDTTLRVTSQEENRNYGQIWQIWSLVWSFELLFDENLKFD